MKILLPFYVLSLLFLLIYFHLFLGVSVRAMNNQNIEMSQDGFSPQQITINSGDSITFVNKDTTDHWPASDLHPTHTIYPEFDPKQAIHPNSSWSFTPKRSGTFKFHDHLNPHKKG